MAVGSGRRGGSGHLMRREVNLGVIMSKCMLLYTILKLNFYLIR